MKLTYDEYVSFGGKLSESDFLSNIKKSIAYVNRLARMYKVTYNDDNVKFALGELTDTFQAEQDSEGESVSFTVGSYSEKKTKRTNVDYESKRYRIAQTYLDISRAIW